LNDTDSFRFILDTYADGQNGFVFGTNPAGIEYDAQVTNEGQGGSARMRMMRGSGAGFNINWDGSWEVNTKISESGWSVEFAIPFRTLRFPRAEIQSWGINFQRTIRRRKENAYWARLPLQFDLNRVSLAGSVSGIEVPDLRNLKVMPYVLGGRTTDFNVDSRRTGGAQDAGIDIKYGITPSLTLDATYNTDFVTGRGGRGADQPGPFLPVLSREETILPGKRGTVLRRRKWRSRTVLQPADRHF